MENKNLQHPLQPLISDETGRLRFKENAIVIHLLDQGPFDMNSLAIMDFTVEDQEQFAQLIGYSLDGFGELSYVRDETYDAAARMVTPEATKDPAKTQGVKSAPMAVYHYGLIVDNLMDRRDGVITMRVIAGAGDYELAKHLIAEEEGIPVDGMHLTSLSFVGETIPK